MTTMEFDELQKIWDAQNNQPLYVIDEKALHNRILSKMNKTSHITNISELLLIIVNFGAGSFILWFNVFGKSSNLFLYLLAAWMYTTFIYVCVRRSNRIKGGRRFDRSMHGDLGFAISVATYQVRLSQIMRWNILPIGALTLLGLWESGKSFWVVGAIALCLSLAFYGGKWEHNIYKARKRELEILQGKLEEKN